jgi:hypothetical protein
MPADPTYSPGVSRKAGGNVLVVGPTGRISSGAGSPVPTTGTLATHVTSAVLTGNDFAGSIVTTNDNTLASPANSSLFVVTFGTPRTTAPIVHLTNNTPANCASAFAATVTTTGFTVVNLLALTINLAVTIGYLVIDVE